MFVSVCHIVCDMGGEVCVVCERVHVRMMLVHSNIHRELTAQVKGAAKIMVTVVATQELEAGDVLRRFGAETAQDDPLRGNNDRCITLRLVVVGVWKLSPPMGFFSLVSCAFLLLFSLVHVSV